LRCRRTRGNRHSTRLSVWPWPAEPAVVYLASSGTMGRRSIETTYFNKKAGDCQCLPANFEPFWQKQKEPGAELLPRRAK